MFILQNHLISSKITEAGHFLPEKKHTQKSSVLITQRRVQADDYPNEKRVNSNQYVPYLLSVFLTALLHIVEDRWISIPVVVSHVTVWAEHSGENKRAKWVKRGGKNTSADCYLFPDFRFFVLINPHLKRFNFFLNKTLFYRCCLFFFSLFLGKIGNGGKKKLM